MEEGAQVRHTTASRLSMVHTDPQPTGKAVIAGVTRDGHMLFMHTGPIDHLHLPQVPVRWCPKEDQEASEEERLSSSVDVINDAYTAFVRMTNFSTGEYGLVGTVSVHRDRVWLIVVTNMSMPKQVPVNVHLIPFKGFWRARERMGAQDPTLRAVSKMVAQELLHRGVIDEYGEMVPSRW